MAKLDRMQIEHVARLARLDSTSASSPNRDESSARLARLPVASGELTKFGEQLSKIADYVGKISNVKASAFAEASADKQNSKVSREDEIKKECLTQEEAVSNAKNVHNGLFLVPAIFEE